MQDIKAKERVQARHAFPDSILPKMSEGQDIQRIDIASAETTTITSMLIF
jgi:hypothetical protein